MIVALILVAPAAQQTEEETQETARTWNVDGSVA